MHMSLLCKHNNDLICLKGVGKLLHNSPFEFEELLTASYPFCDLIRFLTWVDNCVKGDNRHHSSMKTLGLSTKENGR